MKFLEPALILLAVAASVATSAPYDRVAFEVSAHERVRTVLDRDTDFVALDVVITANAAAMSMPEPIVVLEEREEGEPLQVYEDVPPFHASLTVFATAKTKGITGIGANDTDVVFRIVDPQGQVLTEGLTTPRMQEPSSIELWIDGLFEGCALGEPCTDVYTIEVESSERSRVRALLELDVDLVGTEAVEAPEDAAITIELL